MGPIPIAATDSIWNHTSPRQNLIRALTVSGVFKIADDILITGLQLGDTAVETGQDHDQNLTALLDQCRERNTTLASSHSNTLMYSSLVTA